MRTAAATAAAAGARSPPLPARPLARSLSPPLPAPPPPGAGPGESGALPEDAAAAVPCAARAPPRPESPAGASAEASGAPSLPTFSGGSPPPPGGGCQLPTKNNHEGTLGVSLPARNGAWRGTRPAAPHVPAPGPLRTGGSGGTWETRAHRDADVPGRAGAAAAGQEDARAVAWPHLPSFPAAELGARGAASVLALRSVHSPDPFVRKRKNDPYKPFLFKRAICDPVFGFIQPIFTVRLLYIRH